MPRSEREILEQVYRRSAAIRRHRVIARGVSGFLAVGLIAGVVPFALRGDLVPSAPSPDAPPDLARPPTPTSSPCSCQGPPPSLTPTIRPTPTVGPTPEPPIEPDTPLAFASDRDGGWDIYRMNADGSRVRRLTTNPAPERNPAWSPDGERIAFVRLENLGDLVGDIFVMHADGSRVRFLTKGGTPKWSPDGTRLAFHRYTSGSSGPLNGEIWVIDADGRHERKVAGDALDPAFTPDGRTLVFGGINQAATVGVEGTHRITNVTSVRLDGSRRRQITNNPIYACQPAVSPDGRLIAYIGASPDGNTYHLAVIDRHGRAPSDVLTTGLPRLESTPSWSPDGATIAIGRDPDGDPHYASMFGILDAQPQPSKIVFVALDGGEVLLSRADAAYNDADPAFRPRGP